MDWYQLKQMLSLLSRLNLDALRVHGGVFPARSGLALRRVGTD